MNFGLVLDVPITNINMHSMTMLQYYTCLDIALMVILVLELGLGVWYYFKFCDRYMK